MYLGLYNRFIAGYCVEWSALGIEQSKWFSSYRKYIKKKKPTTLYLKAIRDKHSIQVNKQELIR